MKRFLPVLPVGLVALYLFTSFLVLAMRYTSRRAFAPPAASLERHVPPATPAETTAESTAVASIEDTQRAASPALAPLGREEREPITLREVMVLGFRPHARPIDPGIALAEPPSRAWECGAWRPLASGPETQSVRYCQ